ncbi:MAG: DUF192 domain-containing protein [Candidatus Yonathbacteria bacterium]|nr:DUF192 domain-containing protein [Candidatus Yonathbacteria bacterium]
MNKTTLIGRLLLGALYTSIAVAIIGTAMLAVRKESRSASKVVIGGEEIKVTLADTPSLQSKGLSGSKELKPNEGMLFIFQKSGLYGFWMKDMLFPIDIIWFDVNRHIVDVWENAAPDSYPKIFTPHAPAQFVLEVDAGFFAEHHLRVGNMFELLR